MFHKVCTVADNDKVLTEEVLKECRQKPKLEKSEDTVSEEVPSDQSEWEQKSSYTIHKHCSFILAIVIHGLINIIFLPVQMFASL